MLHSLRSFTQRTLSNVKEITKLGSIFAEQNNGGLPPSPPSALSSVLFIYCVVVMGLDVDCRHENNVVNINNQIVWKSPEESNPFPFHDECVGMALKTTLQ